MLSLYSVPTLSCGQNTTRLPSVTAKGVEFAESRSRKALLDSCTEHYVYIHAPGSNFYLPLTTACRAPGLSLPDPNRSTSIPTSELSAAAWPCILNRSPKIPKNSNLPDIAHLAKGYQASKAKTNPSHRGSKRDEVVRSVVSWSSFESLRHRRI